MHSAVLSVATFQATALASQLLLLKPEPLTCAGPSEAPVMAPASAPAALSNTSQSTHENTTADAVPTQTPVGTPAVSQPPSNSTISTATGSIG